MKPAPKLPPSFLKSDIVEARQVLGREPGQPVGVVMSPHGFAELQAYGCRFPCPVAVVPTLHRDAIEWLFLTENFQPFSDYLRA